MTRKLQFKRELGLLTFAVIVGWAQSAAIAQDSLYEQYSESAHKLMQQKNANYAEAEKMLRAALFQAQRYGQSDKRYHKTLRDLADLNYRKADFKEAIPLYKQSIALTEKSLKALKKPASRQDAHLQTRILVSEYCDLSDCYRGVSKFKLAVGGYERAVALLDEIGDKDTLQAAEARSELGDVYTILGRFQEAQPLYERALAIIDNIKNDKSVDQEKMRTVLMDTLQDFAILLRNSGRTAQADALLKELRHIAGITPPAEHDSTIKLSQ